MGFLAGKRALVVGVASNRSIAWGIAQAMHREGAELAFTYLGEKLKPRLEQMAHECESDIVLPCDVASDQQIDDVFAQLKNLWGYVDIIVHSVAFANREELDGDFHKTATRDGFRLAHEISFRVRECVHPQSAGEAKLLTRVRWCKSRGDDAIAVCEWTRPCGGR